MSITAADIRAWIGDFAGVIAEHRQELVRLDTAIGDGDHGTNMDRGMKAAVEKLEATEGDDIGALLKAVGMALVSKVGGAAGPAVRDAVPADGHRDRRQDRARPGGLDGGAWRPASRACSRAARPSCRTRR